MPANWRPCKECGVTKPEREFPLNGKYRRRTCRKCWYQLRASGRKNPIRCGLCKQSKDSQKFDGTRFNDKLICMSCRNKQRGVHYRHRYGPEASVELYEKMFRKQKGKCAICKQEETHSMREAKKLSFDHNHKTGKIRGLLCHRCNVAIGLLKEDPKIIKAALIYLAA